ncbi:MAG: Uma2 family endonuclease [Ferruginibacter sp.]
MENIITEPALKYNYLTPEEYLEAERKAGHKHELMNGVIVTMTGASLKHNQIVSNLIRDIAGFLKGKSCTVFPSDLRVNIPTTNSFTYPDLTIVCGKPELLDEHFDTLLNPAAIIEVLSPSTESYDRGNKFFTYQQIPSLKEYILIDSNAVQVQTIIKKDDGLWKFENSSDINTALTLDTIGLQIPLADIYDQVSF